ncbi:MAG: hypothetical protein WC307_06030 [Candidatus Nanoarchaeia archaeon]|jgi:hypothetical protein
MKLNEIKTLKIQHFLNEALRESLDFLKIRVNEEIAYVVSLELDYQELLDKFIEHLDLIKKLSKEVVQ